MTKNWRDFPWRLIITIALVVLAIIAIFPIEKKIRLGLDLKGGSHILLECVDSPEAPLDEDSVKRVVETVSYTHLWSNDPHQPFKCALTKSVWYH